ncbi:MAG: sensor signal transduction histidine kinase [Cytophagaceae bacterium]|jgi:signal transduction histidine kinase|nr:sensor signal transduction histidine kinase [Cytophagaceae bacterium]
MQRLVLAVQELSLARDLESVMTIVRKAARELTGADGATFILRDEEQCFYADEDAIGPLWKGLRFPINDCISGWSMIHREQVVIEDITIDERIPQEAYSPTFVKSLVMVPIRTLDPIGAIGNYWGYQHRATQEEVMLLQSLADVTAVSLENIKLYNELEKRVVARTEQLEDANKEMEAFSYSISHDLRAPLRSIQLYTDMLQTDYADQLNDAGKKLLGKLLSKTQNMEKLIKELLEFFRMGKKELAHQKISMYKMVNDLIALIKEEEKGRALEFIVHPLPDIHGDNTLMKQVWINLISNAVKYTAYKEKAVIEIGAQEKETSIIYCIKDNGAGFDMNYADKLFKIFQRLHSQEKFEGIGIGLSFVHRIIQKHKGKVWAEAKEDQGATFFFELNKDSSGLISELIG